MTTMRLYGALITTMSCAACQPARITPPPAPTVVNTGCTVFGRIQVPRADQPVVSPTLLERIHQHNLAYDAQCSKKK